MNSQDQLVSIGLPVRNGANRIERVVQSVLAQDHARIELVICDNASTDGTEELCRRLAAGDDRIRYYRHAANIGLLSNFEFAIHVATGDYFRWISDDDWLEPTFASRTLDAFAEDQHRVLVTTRIAYHGPDGRVQSDAIYRGEGLTAADPVERLREWLKLLNQSYLVVDPLYGLFRRSAVVDIPRRNMMREDEIFATSLAVVGRWGHVPEILAHRHTKAETRTSIADLLGVPRWQARCANTLEFSEMFRRAGRAGLTSSQTRHARAAIIGGYVDRQKVLYSRRAWKVARLVGIKRNPSSPIG